MKGVIVSKNACPSCKAHAPSANTEYFTFSRKFIDDWLHLKDKYMSETNIRTLDIDPTDETAIEVFECMCPEEACEDARLELYEFPDEIFEFIQVEGTPFGQKIYIDWHDAITKIANTPKKEDRIK